MNSRVAAVLAALATGSRPAVADGAPEGITAFAAHCAELTTLVAGPATPEPDPLALAVLAEAREGDPGGLLLRYALTMLVVPRLLVSIVDARADSDDPRLGICAEGLVRALYGLAAVAPAGDPDDPEWADRARSLITRLDEAGAAESFPPGR